MTAPAYLPKLGDVVCYAGVPTTHYTIARLNDDGSVALRPVRTDGVWDVPHRSSPNLLTLVERAA